MFSSCKIFMVRQYAWRKLKSWCTNYTIKKDERKLIKTVKKVQVQPIVEKKSRICKYCLL